MSALVAGAGAVLVLWRSSPSLADFMWAEDGTLFLHDAATRSFAATVLQPYAGYAHVVPRVIASLVALAPVEHWAVLVAVAAAAVRGAVAAVCWYATAGYVPSRWLRSALVLVIVALPAGSLEVLNSIANVHWFLLAGAVIAAMWTPRGIGSQVVRAAMVALAVLSDPVALGVGVILAARVVIRRGLGDAALLAVFAIAAGIQLFVVWGSDRAVITGRSLLQIVELYAVRVGYQSVLGTTVAQRLFNLTTVCIVLGVLAVVLAVGVLRRDRVRPFVAMCLVASVGTFTAAQFYIPRDPLLTGDFQADYALRYAVAPMIFMLAAFVGSCSSLGHGPRGVKIAVVPIAAVVASLFLAGFAATFHRPATTSAEGWRAQVAAVAAACGAGARTGVVAVEPSGWALELSCSLVVDGG